MNRRQLIAGGAAVTLVAAGSAGAMAWSMGSSQDYDAAVAAMRTGLGSAPATLDLVRYATLAANSHNTQPWRFHAAASRILILPDFARRTPAVDPDDHHLFASLGCAVENLAIASAARGRPGEVEFLRNDGGVAFTSTAGASVPSALFDAIPRRQSTRADYDGRSVAAADLRTLAAAAAMPGVDVVLVTDRPRIDRIADLVARGNSAQRADPAFVRELKQWLRFSSRTALEHGDGLFSVATGNPALPPFLGPLFFDLFAGVEAENEKYVRQLRSSAGVAVFMGTRADPEHWVQVGRSCQRFALQATALGLKHAHINQPVEVAVLRPELASLIGAAGRRPDIVMRFGHGPTLPYSARRPVQSVLA